MKVLEIIIVDFGMVGRLLIRYSALGIYWRKKMGLWTVHQQFIDFNRA
jgi:hypothetical protein